MQHDFSTSLYDRPLARRIIGGCMKAERNRKAAEKRLRKKRKPQRNANKELDTNNAMG